MKTAITIGRSSSCDIILPDTNMKISREHARISISGGRYVFENLGRHGSYMNGCMMGNERVVIAPGTPILLANMEPLPWNEIYRLLPLKGVVVERPAERETYAPQIPGSLHVNVQENGLYQPVVEEKKSNGMGITGFVLSLVAIILFWVPALNVVLFLLGLIFSIIGIVRKPKGFAIAGLIISGVNAILTTSFYIGFFNAMSSSYYYYY